jgi:hypothetical protein
MRPRSRGADRLFDRAVSLAVLAMAVPGNARARPD